MMPCACCYLSRFKIVHCWCLVDPLNHVPAYSNQCWFHTIQLVFRLQENPFTTNVLVIPLSTLKEGGCCCVLLHMKTFTHW